MTAVRWWVKMFARWQARIDAVKGQVQVISIAVTGYSTFSLVLQGAGLGEFVLPLGLILVAVAPIYAYMFFEHGVWNQVSRDRADMSSNYAGPNQRIGTEFTVRGLGALEKGRELTEDERKILQKELDETFSEYRDGIEIDD